MAKWTDFVARALGLDAGSDSSDAPKADAPNPLAGVPLRREGVGSAAPDFVSVSPQPKPLPEPPTLARLASAARVESARRLALSGPQRSPLTDGVHYFDDFDFD
jgi:hypothetical protein